MIIFWIISFLLMGMFIYAILDEFIGTIKYLYKSKDYFAATVLFIIMSSCIFCLFSVITFMVQGIVETLF